MSLYQHILLAVDFSEDSPIIAHKAQEIARAFGAKLTILHVVEAVPEHSIGYMMDPDLIQKFVAESRVMLASIGSELKIPESALRVEVGSIKGKILEVAEELGVGLLLIGRHGRHGLGALLGSTAGSLLHGVQCDLLTIKVEG